MAPVQRRKRRLRIEQRLRKAIERGDLAPHYQPEVDMRDGRIVVFEALARWTDDQLGPASPAEFIPVAKEAGLISALTELMFRKVLADLPTLCQRFPEVRVAFNTSPDLLEKDGVWALLTELNRAHGGLCEALELEITETHLAGVSAAFMASLHQENCRRVVRSILSLSSALGLEASAEGVETEAQRGQGWLYSRAMPLRQVLALPQLLEVCTAEA
ncbi:EAL domain-containing protein [Ramlibacter sp. 2FC]|uniref:EAL domain-containing protein n=1 Tax=Ramlibacter sp. 2FC TaxID=2502188 RepID=UPI0014853D71|nr:EAL domain-containing protein [Ramlibacter sp. 2FC]